MTNVATTRLMAKILLLNACLMAVTAREAIAASITIEQVVVTTNVDNGIQSDFDLDFGFLSPHSITVESSVAPSLARAFLQWQWNSESGQFNTDVTNIAIDSNPGFDTRITGGLRVQALTDVILHAQASYTYDLPPEDLFFALGLNYRDVAQASDPSNSIGLLTDEAIVGHVAGTQSFDEQVLLLAGHRYDITWSSRMLGGGGSNSIGTGTGFVNLSLMPVPEPAMASALVIGALTLARGRRNRFGQIR